MTTWRNIRSAYVRARLRLRLSVGRPHRTSRTRLDVRWTCPKPASSDESGNRSRAAVVGEQVRLVVQKKDARRRPSAASASSRAASAARIASAASRGSVS